MFVQGQTSSPLSPGPRHNSNEHECTLPLSRLGHYTTKGGGAEKKRGGKAGGVSFPEMVGRDVSLHLSPDENRVTGC